MTASARLVATVLVCVAALGCDGPQTIDFDSKASALISAAPSPFALTSEALASPVLLGASGWVEVGDRVRVGELGNGAVASSGTGQVTIGVEARVGHTHAQILCA